MEKIVKRWTAPKKMEVVLRILRGASLEELSREIGVPASQLEEWHRTAKKGNKWHFGMKMHIGADAKSGLIHTIEGTTAKTADKAMLFDLLHGEEDAVFGDNGYVSKEDKKLAREAGIYWGVLDKRGPKKRLSNTQKKKNKRHSSVRSKVEHPFQVIKHLWGHSKVRYKGLMKNCVQSFTLAVLYNLYKVRRKMVFY